MTTYECMCPIAEKAAAGKNREENESRKRTTGKTHQIRKRTAFSGRLALVSDQICHLGSELLGRPGCELRACGISRSAPAVFDLH
jgi:hypothetical protein